MKNKNYVCFLLLSMLCYKLEIKILIWDFFFSFNLDENLLQWLVYVARGRA